MARRTLSQNHSKRVVNSLMDARTIAHPSVTDIELAFCKANSIPPPHVSIEERLQLMCTYRPGHYLYRNRCAKTGKSILSSIPPEKGIVVYDVEAWLGGDWDARSYGTDYSFERPFFEQFADLLHRVPLPSLSGTHASLENAPYCNFITAARNCYLVFSGQNLEDCFYGRFLYHSRDIVDSFFVRHSELCYGSRDILSCYNVHFATHCQHCSDSEFLFACRSCSHCYGCVNLSGKKFCWYNRQLSETEWQRRRAQVDLGNRAVLNQQMAEFETFVRGQPIRCIQGDRYENSSGNFLTQVADCLDCSLVSESESLTHCIWINKAKSCIATLGFGGDSELLYNCTGVGNRAYNVKFSSQCRQNVRDIEYCMLVENGSHDCFGCISIRNGSYCILNKQYRPDDYFNLVGKIKDQMRASGEYGQFFPAWMSPYSYNESDAALFFPLEREAALASGFNWVDQPGPAAETVPVPTPTQISDIDDRILNQTLRCVATGKNFRLQKQELDLLKKFLIAPPDLSPFERIRRGGEFLAWRRTTRVTCRSCGQTCQSTYDPGRFTIVCEGCFQRIVH